MSQDLFGRIEFSAAGSDANYIPDGRNRWLKKHSDDDLELMINAKVEVLPLGLRSKGIALEYDGKRFFCFVGFARPGVAPGGLVEIEVTPGLFATVVTQGNIPSLATAAQATEILADQYLGIEGYDGHELNLVLPLFPSMSFYVAEGDYVYHADLSRVSGAYIVQGYNSNPLELSAVTKDSVVTLFEAGPDTIPFHLILQGLLSHHWSAFFLELYRSLEQLYSAPRLDKLLQSIKFEGTCSDLSDLLERVLTWRPREEDALATLLSKCSNETLDDILNSFGFENPEEKKEKHKKCAEYIYELRNKNVHFRPAMKMAQMSNDQWNEIISSMCFAVEDVYIEFGAKFLGARQLQTA